MSIQLLRFPEGFLWGCATSSYQIEGGFDEDGRGDSIWDRFSKTPGKTYNGDTGDVACDHYHRFENDVNIMAEVGLKAYRFSVSWPRVIPAGKGRVNEKGLDFYERLVDNLLSKDIIPFLTLYHWDLPQALEDRGGWRQRDTAYAFGDYTKVLVKRLSDRVKYWMTINEPPGIALSGYQDGYHAPGAKESPKVVNQVIHHLLLAHGIAVKAVHECGEGLKVGIVSNPSVFIPKTDSPEDTLAAKMCWEEGKDILAEKLSPNWNEFWFWWLDAQYKGKYPDKLWRKKGEDVPEIKSGDMEIIATPTDFFGLNIYSATGFVEFDKDTKGFKQIPIPDDYPKNSMGWYIIPECLYYCLKQIKERYNVNEFYITENGFAWEDKISTDGKVHDPERIAYLRSHIAQVHRLISERINLKGYFLWSILDNFEWRLGYPPRAGIVYTDYPTQRRIFKDSALWYKEIIAANSLDINERRCI